MDYENYENYENPVTSLFPQQPSADVCVEERVNDHVTEHVTERVTDRLPPMPGGVLDSLLRSDGWRLLSTRGEHAPADDETTDNVITMVRNDSARELEVEVEVEVEVEHLANPRGKARLASTRGYP